MSYEIRAPLNGIIGMMQLFQHTSMNAKQKDYIDKTMFSAKSLLAIVSDILDFSKIEAGKMELETAPFCLDKIKASVSSTISVAAAEKDLNFEFNIEKDIPKDLIGDPTRLMQVLLNLSANAVKFTDKGKVTVDINLVKICNEWVNLRFSITDTGIGISQKNIPHLFESFKQADSATTRRFGGSGLGLTVSQEIVKLMGSEINVSSQLGKGSCF